MKCLSCWFLTGLPQSRITPSSIVFYMEDRLLLNRAFRKSVKSPLLTVLIRIMLMFIYSWIALTHVHTPFSYSCILFLKLHVYFSKMCSPGKKKKLSDFPVWNLVFSKWNNHGCDSILVLDLALGKEALLCKQLERAGKSILRQLNRFFKWSSLKETFIWGNLPEASCSLKQRKGSQVHLCIELLLHVDSLISFNCLFDLSPLALMIIVVYSSLSGTNKQCLWKLQRWGNSLAVPCVS